jgi:DNA-binding NtrC family response regulator
MVLVVDDDRIQRELLLHAVQSAGYEADTAADGAEAIRLAAGRRYDMVLLDFQMPGLNGVELFSKLQAAQPWLRGLLVTAYGSIRTIYPAVCVGLSRVLAKPVDVEELLQVMADEMNCIGDGS